MAVTIKLKNASGSDPTASDLVVGEVAIRTDTGKLFTKKDDNSVAEISGGGISDGDKGDITVSSSGATFTIDNDVVTFAKMQNVSTSRLLGRTTSSSGDIEELTASAVRTLLNVADGATNVSTENIQDVVGGMVTGNTETGITVTYQDGDGTLDFVVGTLNQDTTGNAATATALETARTIGGTSFDGTGNITPAECTNADTVDSLHASSFVRSDAADVMSQSTQGTATLDVRNTGGAGSGTGTGAIIAKFVGDSDAIEVRNIASGDYGIYNNQQDNGFELYDGTGGVRIIYNGTNAVEFDSGNTYGDFKGVPTVNGTNLARVSDNITGTSGGFTAGNASNLDSGTIPAARIADDAITYAKIQNVSATNRILGRDSSGAGVIEEITPANLRTMINVADGANVGIAASGGEFTGDITTHDVVPDGNNTRDLGSSSARWSNLFVNDMHFANSPENVNKVDGTWGDWTLQEGEEFIYMLNNRNGKKYKMNLTEIE